jgi:hypothetical protein
LLLKFFITSRMGLLMKNDRQLMQQALDAFESCRAADRAEAMNSLRAALVTPPRREWVSLTDEDLNFWAEELGQEELGKGVLRAVDEYLKEKNT